MLFLKLLKVLNGDAHPAQVAFGVWVGCMLGLTPLIGAHSVLLFLFVLVFRINLGAVTLTWAATKPLGYFVLAKYTVPLGHGLLEEGSGSRDVIVALLKTPVIGLIELEKHAVSGGIVAGCVFGLVLVLPIVFMITSYRRHVKEGFRNSKFMKHLSRTWLFKLFKGMLEGTPEA